LQRRSKGKATLLVPGLLSDGISEEEDLIVYSGLGEIHEHANKIVN